MPKPISRRELIRRLRVLGWEGPWSKGPHAYMRKAGRRLPIPHGSDIDWSLAKRILRIADISPEEWERP